MARLGAKSKLTASISPPSAIPKTLAVIVRMTRNIAILFGAGASYGAGSILPERPPLGNQLFLELQRLYPNSWGTITEDLKSAFLENFELGMKMIWDNYSHSVAPLMQNMSEYFIQFRPVNNASLYCELIKKLASIQKLESVSFTSLNYDIILELSLLNNGFNINYFSPESEVLKEIEVLKIHGSSNFMGTEIYGGKGISYGAGVTFNGGIKATLDSSEVIENYLVQSGIAPVMSLYMEGKPVNVSPQIIAGLQETYKIRCTEAKAIVVIGVRPIMADKHIWDTITSAKGVVYYVGSTADLSTLKEARKSVVHLGEYFNTSFNNIINCIYETN